jgi:hypothetical protein
MTIGILSLVLAGQAFAQSSEADYLKLLEVAQKHVRDQRVRELVGSGGGSPAAARAVLGLERRFFAPGNHWTVEVTPNDIVDARKTAEPGAPATREPRNFEFRVLDVDASHLATIEIRGSDSGPLPAVSLPIEREELVVNDRFVVERKVIHYRDGRPTLELKRGGTRNVASGFDPFPTDLPDLAQAGEGAPLRDVPAELRGAGLDPAKARDFRFSDLYGRPVRAIWRDGDVWPIYVSAPAGTAVVRAWGDAK